MKLALGTVQFGLAYGIANEGGKPGEAEVADILATAQRHGITTLDTAVSYGDAETVLGSLLGTRTWRIITKLPGLPTDLPSEAVRAWCETQVRSSAGRLRVQCLDGVLLHRPRDLVEARGDALATALLALKGAGLAKATGISIYAPDELDLIAAERGDAFRHTLDIVQAPLNVFDRQLETSGWAEGQTH